RSTSPSAWSPSPTSSKRSPPTASGARRVSRRSDHRGDVVAHRERLYQVGGRAQGGGPVPMVTRSQARDDEHRDIPSAWVRLELDQGVEPGCLRLPDV